MADCLRFFLLAVSVRALTLLLAAQIASEGTDLTFKVGTGTNSTVQVITPASEGRILIGGHFTLADNQPRLGLAQLLPYGEVDPSFVPALTLPTEGSVFTLLPQPDGGILVGGYLQSAGTPIQHALIRLTASGSLDTSFRSPFGSESVVFALAKGPSGTIYVGGTFTTTAGAPRRWLVRLHGNGALDTNFAPSLEFQDPLSVSPFIAAVLVLEDGSVVAGGGFSFSGGSYRPANLIKVNHQGAFDEGFVPAAASGEAVTALALDAKNNLIVGGNFRYGELRNQPVRRLSLTGRNDETFKPRFENSLQVPWVNSLVVEPSGRIIAGGSFSQVNGIARSNLVRLLSDGSVDERFAVTAQPNEEVASVAQDESGKILIGGDFLSVGDKTNVRIARLLNPVLPTRFLTQPQDTATTSGGNVRLAAQIEPDGIETLQWYRNGVPLSEETASELYLVNQREAATFHLEATNPSGVVRSERATITVSPAMAGSVDRAYVPPLLTPPSSIYKRMYRYLHAQEDGHLLVSITGSSEPLLHLLRPDGTRAEDFEINLRQISLSSSEGPLSAVFSPNGTIFVQAPARGSGMPYTLWHFNRQGKLDPSFALKGFDQHHVSAFAVLPNGNLLLAGEFSVGSDLYRLVRVGNDGTFDPSFVKTRNAINGAITALHALPDGRMLIIGFFTEVGGVRARSHARLHADGTLDTTYQPVSGFSANDLVVTSSGVVYMSRGTDGWLKAQEDGSADPSFLLKVIRTERRSSGRVFELPARSEIFVQKNGEVLLWGNFDRYNGRDVIPPIRVRADGTLDETFHAPNISLISHPDMPLMRVVAEFNGRLIFNATTETMDGEPRPGLGALYRDSPGVNALINLSTRASAGNDDRVLITGFVVAEVESTRPLLVRAVGPTLMEFGLVGVLSEPSLQFFRGETLQDQNDGWAGRPSLVQAASRAGAFAFPLASRDAALIANVRGGNHTAQIRGTGGDEGIALAEVYSIPGEGPTLLNLSTRGQAGRGEDALIGGFVLHGQGRKQVLIRAIGPTLLDFGVNEALQDPRLRVVQGDLTLASNDNWSDDRNAGFTRAAARATGAFKLPEQSQDAAILLNLPTGAYTVIVEPGPLESRGVVLVEIYDVTR